MSGVYTYHELMMVCVAKEVRDREVVVMGQGLPMIACLVAKLTHAPNSILLTEAGIVDIVPTKALFSVGDPTAVKGFSYFCDLFDVNTIILNRGLVDLAVLGAAQVDKYGNVNSTIVKNQGEVMRITGCGGAPEFAAYAKRTVITLVGGRFVEKLDYFSTPGYFDGGDSRYRAGFPPRSGPSAVVTLKGIFRFDEKTKELYLDAIYPGVTVEEVRKDIPWELKVSPKLKVVEPPSKEYLEAVRKLAPEYSLPTKSRLSRRVQAATKQIFT
ncbi:MAG: CoA-transferase [Candidatus Jordarchaeales archaeon]